MVSWSNTPMQTYSLIVVGLFLSILFGHADCAFSNWQTSGNVAWAFGCDFPNHDLSNVRSSGELCGPRCEQTPSCTHFTWTNHNGGTCWLKKDLVKTSQWPFATDLIETNDNSMVCGFIHTR